MTASRAIVCTMALQIGLLAAIAEPASAGTGSTLLVATKKLSLKDTGVPEDFKAKIVIKDGLIDPVLLDPTITGATVYLYSHNTTQYSDDVQLPAGGWTAKGTGFKFKLQEGSDKISAKMKPGKLVLKVRGPAFDYAVLNAPQSGAISYRFSFSGPDYVCGTVPGMEGTLKKDDPDKGIYKAGNSEAPAMCPAFID